MTEGIVEHHTIAVRSPHEDGDAARSTRGTDGRGYAKYGIGLSPVAIPAYLVSDQVLEPLLPITGATDSWGNQRYGPGLYGTALTNAVVGLTVALSFLLALECGFDRRTALTVTLLLANCTFLAHYAATFLSEPLSALCLIATVYGLARASGQRSPARRIWPWLALSGFTAGLALATKPANGVTLVAPALWLGWIARQMSRASVLAAVLAVVSWSFPVAIWLTGIGWYNWLRFGSVTETGYGAEARQCTTPLLEGMTGLLVSPGRGVIWYDLPLMLSLGGGVLFLRRRPDVGLVVLGMLLGTLLLYGRFYIWWGGGAWGTRFLVPLLPLHSVPAGEIVERAFWSNHRDRRLAAAVWIVATAGLAVTLLGILVPFDRYVMEYSASPARPHDALWKPAASPLVVHARELSESLSSPTLPKITTSPVGSVRSQ